MKIDRLRVMLEPGHQMDGFTEVRTTVWVNGEQYIAMFTLPPNHFESLFDRMMARAIEHIKERLREVQHA